MDITNLNFLEKLPEISETIRECDFIAIDTELSGLMRERSLNRFDLPEERFAKEVDLSRGYFIMQFGLSCFTRVGSLHQTNRTYNFYIFPQANQGYGDIDRTFSLQAHAIQFLSEHGFDFNKLFKHGVSYLTFQEKKTITAQLKAESKARAKVEIGSSGLPKFVPNQMVDNCKDWLKRTKKFIEERKNRVAGNKGDDDLGVPATKQSILSELAKDDGNDSEMTELVCEPDCLELRGCCTNHKRAIFKRLIECQPLFENVEFGTKTDLEKNETFLVINYIDKTVKEEKQKNALITAKGFLEVLELVIVNKKPLVGHNLALDLIQIINQFMEPLTNNYNSFKEICHSLFPLIYDTKFIAHSILEPETLTNNQSRLYDLYCQLQDSETLPKIKVDHLGEFIDDKQMPHQAGYDAYMSGYCFLSLCEGYMMEKKKYKFKKEEPGMKPPESIVQEHQIITDFANKVHLSYSYDFKFFDLNGDEEEPDRNHVFYLEFPHTWGLEDIFQVFYEYGGVSVSRLSKTSALCALRDAKQIKGALEKVQKLKESNSNHKIFTYDTYLQSIKPRRKRETGDEDVEFFDA